MDSDPNTEEVIRVDLGIVHMTSNEREFIWGAVEERSAQANAVGVYYTWPDFVRQALIEAAQR
jgi:hypothetical protein